MEMPVPDAQILARRSEIVAVLEAALPERVIADLAGLSAYECDALTAFRARPLAVVLPCSTAEVARVLRLCAELGVKVVARGAGTSLAGGSLPTEDAVVIGLARLNQVLEIDYISRAIHVGAGITNLQVSAAVDCEGWFYAPDPSSQLACAIGGNIAMNSGLR